MKKKKSGLFLTVLPLYLFTLCFVVGPLLYMVALSFATNGSGSSTIWSFTLEKFKKFCAVFSACHYQYPVDCTYGVSFRIFYGEAFSKMEETNDAFDYDTFLDEFFNSYVWLDFNFAGKRCFKRFLDETGDY